MDDLYRDYILDHYKRPRNFGELEPHDLEAHEHNPLCGDELGVHIRVADERICDIRFHGHGCAISQASASIASEELKGMELERVGALAATCKRQPSSSITELKLPSLSPSGVLQSMNPKFFSSVPAVSNCGFSEPTTLPDLS